MNSKLNKSERMLILQDKANAERIMDKSKMGGDSWWKALHEKMKAESKLHKRIN